jgi:hypothetical protein
MGIGLKAWENKASIVRPINDERKVDKTVAVEAWIWRWTDKRIDEGYFVSYGHVVRIALKRLISDVRTKRFQKGG